jgi:hypothetical protein
MALGINPVLANTAQIKITKMGVPTDLPHENRVSQLAKNTAKLSVAATNRSEEGLDIPKSRKNWLVLVIRRFHLYKVPNWKYNGNKIEKDSASPACGRQAGLGCLAACPAELRGTLFFLFSQRRRDAKELKGLSLITYLHTAGNNLLYLGSCVLLLDTCYFSNVEC